MKTQTGTRAVEKYYTVAETALLIGRSDKTVLKELKEKKFGEQVVDLAKESPEHEPLAHDYRIPASGLNAYLDARRVFYSTEELGISARNESELRRKSAVNS